MEKGKKCTNDFFQNIFKIPEKVLAKKLKDLTA